MKGFAPSARFSCFICSFEMVKSFIVFVCFSIISCACLFHLAAFFACFISSSLFFLLSFVWFSIFLHPILFISVDIYERSGNVNSISNLSKLFIRYCTCLSIQSTNIFWIHCWIPHSSLFFISLAHCIFTQFISIPVSPSPKLSA